MSAAPCQQWRGAFPCRNVCLAPRSRGPSMKRLVAIAPGLTACNLAPAPAFAQLEGNPENWCRDGAFPRESKTYRLTQIKGAAGDKVHFHDDGEERCPGHESCRTKAYVIPNDQVVVSRRSGSSPAAGFSHARARRPLAGSKPRGSRGWKPGDRLPNGSGSGSGAPTTMSFASRKRNRGASSASRARPPGAREAARIPASSTTKPSLPPTG